MTAAFKVFEARQVCEHCARISISRVLRQCNDGRYHHLCGECAKPIPFYYRLEPNGYESASAHHVHLEVIDPATQKAAWVPIMRELCAECYLVDYFATFPGAKMPDLSNHPPVYFGAEPLAAVEAAA